MPLFPSRAGVRPAFAVVLATVAAAPAWGQVSTDAFVYQGVLEDNGSPATGLYDIRVRAFDTLSGPGFLSCTATFPSVAVQDGLFELVLPCGDEFTVEAGLGFRTYLEIEVAPAGSGTFTPLSPRQEVRAAPKAAWARFASGSGTNLTEAYANGPLLITNAGNPAVVGGPGGLRVEPPLTLGAEGTLAGELRLFGTTAGATPYAQLSSFAPLGPSLGGQFLINRATSGGTAVSLQPDFNDGGFLAIARDNANSFGITLDGNVGGGSPRVTFQGTASSMQFSTNTTGDGSVSLPSGAISAAETLDEAGVAADLEGTSGVALTNTTVNVAQRTISVPAPGYVIALGTLEFSLGFTSAHTGALLTVGVSETIGGFAANSVENSQTVPAGGSGGQIWSVAANNVFRVNSAGTFTCYLRANTVMPAGGTATAFDHALILVYVPTAYGSVAAPPVTAMAPETPSTPARLRPALDSAAEIQAELDRVRAQQAAEAERTRAELAALRAELERVAREQHLGRGSAAEQTP